MSAIPVDVNPSMIGFALALGVFLALCCAIVALCRFSRRSKQQKQILQRIIELGGLSPKVDTNRVSYASSSVRGTP